MKVYSKTALLLGVLLLIVSVLTISSEVPRWVPIVAALSAARLLYAAFRRKKEQNTNT